MGAFGRLLESYFGGTIHDVKTWGKYKKTKATHNCDKCKKEVTKVTYVPFYKIWLCNDCHTEYLNFPNS